MIVVRQTDLLGERGRAHGALDHRVEQHVAGVFGLGALRVLVHDLGEEALVERAPVDADAHRLAVFDRHLHDLGEVGVAVLGAYVAGIDAVLGQRARAGRVAGQQQVPVVVEVADDGHVEARVTHALDQLGDRLRGLVGVDRNAHQFAARFGQVDDLLGGADRIGRVGVGHGLHHHRVRSSDPDRTHTDLDGLPAFPDTQGTVAPRVVRDSLPPGRPARPAPENPGPAVRVPISASVEGA
jgi:hypothetical protein